MPFTGKSVRIVMGLILLIDGIGLAAFSIGADLLGAGQGYGFGWSQILGLLAGLLISGFGLAILVLLTRHPGS